MSTDVSIQKQTQEFAAKVIEEAKSSEIANLETYQAEEAQDLIRDVANDFGEALASEAKRRKDAKTLDKRNIKPPKTSLQEHLEKRRILPDKDIEDQKSQFSNDNPDLTKDALQHLLDAVKECSSAQSILDKVMTMYQGNTFLIHEALEFLLATTTQDLKALVSEAHDIFLKENNILSEDIKNMGLGRLSRAETRALSQTISQHVNQPAQLLTKLLSIHGSSYEMRKKAFKMLHFLGSGLKQQTLEAVKMQDLRSEIKNLQDGLAIFGLLQETTAPIRLAFTLNKQPVPPSLTSENMVRALLDFLVNKARFSTAETIKVYLIDTLKLSDIQAQSIVLSQYLQCAEKLPTSYFASPEARSDILGTMKKAMELLIPNDIVVEDLPEIS